MYDGSSMARPHLPIIPVPALIPQTLAAGMLLVFAAISAVTVMAGFFRDNADVAGTEVTQLPEDLVPDVGSSAPDEGFRLPVLRYRHIGQAGPGQPDAVPPEVLDRQLAHLLNSGYAFLRVSG